MWGRIVLGVVLGLLLAGQLRAAPQSTAFTYQGELKQNGTPVDGAVNFQFRLWDDSIAGAQVAPQVTRNGVLVEGGRFAVEIDFGYVFGTEQRWIEVIANGVPLTPRQPLTVTPMAMYALSGLQGPQGVQGVQGVQGPQGMQGVQGPDGAPLVFGGTAHESPNRIGTATGSYASPLGISEVTVDRARAEAVLPADCNAGSLQMRFTSANASYLGTTITLVRNGSDTALSCAIALGGVGTASCSNTLDSVALVAGDVIAMRFTPAFPTRPVGNVESRVQVHAGFGFLCAGPP